MYAQNNLKHHIWLEVSEVCVGSVGRIVITYSQGGNRFGGDLKLVEVVGLIRDLKYER